MRILVTGAAGMVGTSMVPALRKSKHLVLATDLILAPGTYKLDVTEGRSVLSRVAKFKPGLVVHLAAETDLEKCQADRDHAYRTNVIGTQNVALACLKHEVPLAYVSTAGVFDGVKDEPYDEFDSPNPINIYGRTKAEGERVVRELLCEHYIVRAGWMFGGGPGIDKKFVAKIIQQLLSGANEIKAVNDKYGTLTYASDFSATFCDLIETGFYGLYHCACKGVATRFDVAKEILRICGASSVTVTPVTSEFFAKEYYAPRPRSEVLRNYMLELRGMDKMRPWREALREYVEERFLSGAKHTATLARHATH